MSKNLCNKCRENLKIVKERNLEEITTFPEQDVYIKADGRYMCRILENVYSNVAKYAMENTRVYLDVVKTNIQL